MRSDSATRDVSSKPTTLRTARARAELAISAAALRALKSGTTPKADPIGVAKVAAIQAAKQTSLLIPFCHPIPLDGISVRITAGRKIVVETEVTAVWKTGVEMEALVAASAAVLTLYDMLKPIDPGMVISSVMLTGKKGGKSDAVNAAMAIMGGQKTVHAAVVTISDSVSRKTSRDSSGRILADRLSDLGVKIVKRITVADDRSAIEALLRRLAGSGVDLIMTTGGTGVGPRDVTPEAVSAVITRRLPGVEHALLDYGQQRLRTAMLSRAVAGTRNGTLIVSVPGSPRAASDAIHALFPALLHALPVMAGASHRRK